MARQFLPKEMEARASEIEELFCGGLIIAAQWASEECPTLWGLEPEDFRDDRWRAVFTAIKTLFGRRKRPTWTNLCHQLQDDGTFGLVGGASEVTRLANAGPSYVTLPDMAESILSNSTRRQILVASGKAAQVALTSQDASTAVEEAQVILREAQARRRGDDSVVRHRDTQGFVYDAVDELYRQAQAGTLRAPDTPWEEVNRMIGSFRAGHLFVLAGYPSHGKSTVMEMIAEHNARNGFQVAFFHLEHGTRWMLFKRVMRMTGAHVYELERGMHMEEALAAEQEVREWPGGVHYVHCPGWTAEQIAQTMTEMRDEGLCDLACTDYLQKLRLASDKGWNLASLVGQAVEVLKTAGERLGIPNLVGSQLNRAGRNTGGKPRLQHLRSSGEIEEKANHVLFLWREIMDDSSLSLDAEMYQEKPYAPGTDLMFNPERLTFYGAVREPLEF